jgi:hypothetical protein
MKNLIMVAVLAVAFTAACLVFAMGESCPGLRDYRRFDSSGELKAAAQWVFGADACVRGRQRKKHAPGTS